MKSIAIASAFAVGALGAVNPYQQCGGKTWTGDTACTSGYVCTADNDYYSGCKPGTVAPPATTIRTTTKTSAPVPTKVPGKLKWLGVDESCAEFGDKKFPGVENKDYRFPDTATISTLMGEGFNTFRIPFAMERMTGTSMGVISEDYFNKYAAVVKFITGKGQYAILDPHNYGRYYGNVITNTADFKKFWAVFAARFKDNDHVIFDTNNEYNTMDQALVVSLNQAAIDGIRSTGSKQYIFVEGNSWSGAHSWLSVNDSMKNLKDPENKIVYEMHQYLDSDSSGTSDICVSSTIGVERLKDATKWLRDNKKVGMLGEFAGGTNDQCKAAVKGMMDFMQANSDVWLGATWWAAGPWWADYIYSFEPPTGKGYLYYHDLLRQYAPAK